FWFPEAQFGCAPGVLRTKVGFTGGKKKGPTYYSLGDHTETIEIHYDPDVTSYTDLLKLFWENHDPTRCASRQYMSAIFYHSDEQKTQAEESKEQEQSKRSKKIQTKIAQAETFYNAEDYHQKYLLRQQRDILQALNLTDEELIKSHIACRLNGYCGGYGKMDELEKELSLFNLPSRIQDRLRAIVSRGNLY
ncbi:PREDICTED: peptide methionine sulfoxide reductase-like, partial [Amphimedon queenslandica]|uniref:peptide-methionine (S)-S-oxide reductase n=1 Tax=Amphimedon queenslandica TaxID=400682 RepID=A0AAN0ILP1_AMPQE